MSDLVSWSGPIALGVQISHSMWLSSKYSRTGRKSTGFLLMGSYALIIAHLCYVNFSVLGSSFDAMVSLRDCEENGCAADERVSSESAWAVAKEGPYGGALSLLNSML